MSIENENEASEMSAACAIRAYLDTDREAAGQLDTPVIDWWHANGPAGSLHLVATTADEGQVVGHLQVVDRNVIAPGRRMGQCHFSLNVAPEHRRCGIGGALYAHAEAFARRQAATMLYTAYIEYEDAPARSFLQKRGFAPLERFRPSYLDVSTFVPERFSAELERVEAQGVRLLTYAEAGDTPENRRKLYDLEQSARATQPFREVDPYVPEPYEAWERELLARDPTAIFLAQTPDGVWAGVVTGLVWYFTGVHPDWRGRGIATALKVRCLSEARSRDLGRMETENHDDNGAMLAINRKLGFVFTTPEVACVKRF